MMGRTAEINSGGTEIGADGPDEGSSTRPLMSKSLELQ